MRFKFQDQITGEIINEWEFNPSQVKFWDSDKKYVLFSGGYGCVAGNTKILDADTLKEKEIKDIRSPFRVFSHNGKKAWALVPVKYEKAPLYRVKTNSYEFIGTAEHQVLTLSGWKKISLLSVSEQIVVSSASLPRSTPESVRSILFSNALHLTKTLQGFLSGYRPVLSFYGGQPRLAKGIALCGLPLPVGVHEHIPMYLRKGGHSFLSKHIRSYLVSSRLSKNSSSPSGTHPLVLGGGNYTFLGVFEYVSVLVRSFAQLHKRIAQNRGLKWLCSILGGSFLHEAYPYPTIKEEKIQSISPAGVDNYYDLHILGTHSYYAQGFFHHNCGKSLMLTLKAIDLSLRYENNYILMGRRTYPELRDTLLKEFFTICPDAFIKDYLKAEGRAIFPNGSEIIFRHLDTIAESEIRSLNLGAAFIDQAEDISKEVFVGLRGRLRRAGVADKDRKIYMSCNPALTWLFADFKQNPEPEYEVIEASTLENAQNLPPEYVADLLKYPESYKKQYVYGVWDTGLLSDKAVFAREYLERMMSYTICPIRTYEGLDIFKEFVEGHRYQMGVDAAEGGESELTDRKTDSAVVVIADLDTEEEVASWSGRIPPDVTADYAAKFARLYQRGGSRCVVVPEMNSIGTALVNRLRSYDDIRIFRREEYDKVSRKIMEKLGWRTSRSTKPLLVSRFQELLRLRDPKIYSSRTVEEFKSFIWTDEAKKQGMGAKTGFHDDRVIATLLAFWQKGEVVAGKVLGSQGKADVWLPRPTLKVVNGKIMPRTRERPLLTLERSWTIT